MPPHWDHATARRCRDERESFVKGMTFLEAELNADAEELQRKRA
jgi:hypothetical protein